MADPRPSSTPWTDRHLWQIQPLRDLLVVASVVVFVWLGYTLRVVTIPLLLAVALAYMFEPIVLRLTRSGKLSRPTAAGLIVVVTAAGIILPALLGLGFGAVQGVQASQTLVKNAEWLVKSVEAPDAIDLRARAPGPAWERMRDWIAQQRLRELDIQRRRATLDAQRELDAALDHARQNLHRARDVEPPDAWLLPPLGSPLYRESPSSVTSITDDAFDPPTPATADVEPETSAPELGTGYQLTAWAISWIRENRETLGRQALRSGVDWVNSAVQGVSSIAYALFIACLTAFFFFFASSEFGRVRTFSTDLIPERARPQAMGMLRKMDRVIAGFIRGRLTIGAILILYYTLAYWGIGVPAWLILGPVVGLLSLLPYMANLGMLVAMVLMWLDPSPGYMDSWWWIIGAPVAVSLIAQILDDYILTPTIQGKETGMDTPSILFASIAGGSIAGIYGLLIAIPAAACLKILISDWIWPKFRAWVAGRAADFLPISKE